MTDDSELSRLISKILPSVSGLIVQIDPRLSGKVPFTELTDSWISNPLSGYHEGKFVKCKVLNIGRSGRGAVHVDLSLRSYGSNRYEKIEELKSDMIIEVNMFVLCF
ncbi:putative nucleic acid-binding, RNA-binding domain, S1 [Helianthus annuus]|nr:putative nucleic acid-binding, RNA-binding domain, S1 [Helianthus annuus]